MFHKSQISVVATVNLESERRMRLRVITEAVGVEKKNVLTVLVSACLLSTLVATGNIETVKASPELPWSITMHATVTTNPYWGYYGGYHDVWQAIKTELAKIGINLEINYYDDFTWYDRVWDTGWNKTWAEGGWDMTTLEWWLQPHAMEPWFSSMCLSDLQPPEGYNIFPWNNTKADILLTKAIEEFDAERRKAYIWKWQEVFMQDPPWINMWYPKIYDVNGMWLDGYDPAACWWYDITNMSLNPAAMPPERKVLHEDWVYHAVSEEVWSLMPNFMDTYTEEQMCTVQWDTLYRWSLKWENFVKGQAPDPTDYIIVPELAAKDPYPVGGYYKQMRVELREGVKWSDYATSGETVDADDVVFTFNTACLKPQAGCTGMGDFVGFLDHVTKVNDTAVDFFLKRPCPDFTSVLANDWGGSILPAHKLTDYDPNPSGMKMDPANYDFANSSAWLPVTGPFKLKEIQPGQYVLLERNPLYFGYDLGWGPDSSVQAIYLKWLPDPAVRLLEFQKYRLDCGEYPTAPIEVWKDLETDPNLNVFQYNYPASNPIWFNFNNEYLSNRYVRLAISYAVPYEGIFSEILPSWGIETAYPGKTPITPLHYYTDPDNVTVHLFNEELEPYEYNITKALKCMEMWWYSTNQPYINGPLGDSDLSGVVDLDDWYIWRENFGTTPAEWIFPPGNDIDPDFNNDLIVDVLKDLPLWADNYGKEYPTTGASALNANTIKVFTKVSPYIAVIPEITVDPTLTPGKNYTVSIYTDYNGTDIWAWQFSLTYNPNILHGIEATNGDLITKEKHRRAQFIPGMFDNEAGKLSLTGAYFFPLPPPIPVTSGPGILANVTFTVVGAGTSNISMGLETGLGGVAEDIELGPGYGGTYIIIDAETMPDHIGHGYFDNTAPPPVVTATIDIDPETLNLRNRGQWITAYIELPEEYNAEEVDATTILLNGTISPVLDPMYEFATNSSEYLVDHDEDGILERMVKFDKAEVTALLSVGEATLTITGEVNGTPFEGSDSIRVTSLSSMARAGPGGCQGLKK